MGKNNNQSSTENRAFRSEDRTQEESWGGECVPSPSTNEARTENAQATEARPLSVKSALKIRLSGPLERDSIVNGYGLRAVLWTQGCLTHCKGCQNPETWDLDGGFEVDVAEIKDRLKTFKGQAGITFCGGEPFLQPEPLIEIAKFAHEELNWNVWSFSGYTYEQIQKKGGKQLELLKNLDALIDGPFILEQRDLSLKFRGSRNQRLLHLKNGEITKVE